MARKGKTAVVIGSGAGGSMATRVLAMSHHFKSVIVLEKGPNYFQNLDNPDFSKVVTLFSNDEIKFGARTGPQTSSDSLDDADPLLDPRRFINPDPKVNANIVGEVNSLPQIVGGGLNHSDWKARRLRPADFKLKTLAGIANLDIMGANVADWPITYDDLEPFYTLAEYIVGIQGPSTLPSPFAPPRSKPYYPMPPGVPQYVALVLANGATKAGLHPFAAPMGATSRPYNGRPVCNDCGFDGGFGCPIGAKSTPAITALRDALMTGTTTLIPNAYAYRLNLDGTRIGSVSYFDAQGDSHELAADVFVIAASAIESARLCLLSGLQNDIPNDNIGRNLMFHFQTLAVGLFFPGRLHAHRGRTVTHMFDDFAGPAQVAQYASFKQPRGGTVELAGGQPLISEVQIYLGPAAAMFFPPPPSPPPNAYQRKGLIQESLLREHLAALTMQGEDLPQFTNRVQLDRTGLKDVFGIPVAQVTYQNHKYEMNASATYAPMMADVLTKAGAAEILALGPATAPPQSQSPVPTSAHILGTLRMGTDPSTSVTDAGGKFHGIDNLYAADGSLFTTSGGMNPSLTIMALGYRVACSIIHPNNPLAVAKAIDNKLLDA